MKSRATERFEEALKGSATDHYVLRLYVTRTQRSSEAMATIRALCKEHLEGRYDLEVIDVREHPELARDEHITAIPTLVKELPLPLRQFIGDLSDEERVLLGLDVLRTTPPKGSAG